ncbi:MAG: hypothetical protein H0T88_06050 [Lysobacter sp.]|nr:hypothetical protein [Lysobacter sp.]
MCTSRLVEGDMRLIPELARSIRSGRLPILVHPVQRGPSGAMAAEDQAAEARARDQCLVDLRCQ